MKMFVQLLVVLFVLPWIIYNKVTPEHWKNDDDN